MSIGMGVRFFPELEASKGLIRRPKPFFHFLSTVPNSLYHFSLALYPSARALLHAPVIAPTPPHAQPRMTTMSRKRLNTNEMLHLSGEWVDPQSPAHQAIRATIDLAPNLARLQAAHQDLATSAQPTALNPRLFEIIKEETDLDDRHDDIIRGIYGLLTATAALLGSDDGQSYITLRDQLIPDGLSSVQKSYIAEAGQAAQLAWRLTPEIHAQLNKIFVGPINEQIRLGVYIEEWIEVAQRLGTLENEKARLGTSSDSTTSTGTNLITSRNKWTRTVNLFVAIAEATELDEATDRLIFGPLRAAEAKAARRGRPSAPSGDTNDAEASPEAAGE
jgi:hypothetical protein